MKNFILLAMFTLLSKVIRTIKDYPSSFKDLSKKNDIPCVYLKDCEENNFLYKSKKAPYSSVV